MASHPSGPSSSGQVVAQASSSSALPVADSRQVSPKKKASPSDVIFGQPPGSDETSQLYEQLTSDSTLLQPTENEETHSATVSPSKVATAQLARAHASSVFDESGGGSGSGSSNNSGRDNVASDGSHARSSSSIAGGSSDSARMDVDRPAVQPPSAQATPSTTATSDAQVPPNEDILDGDANTKRVPALFEDCDAEDVVILVADMLTRLTAHNDLLPLHPSSLTRFHSRATPSITVLSYLKRISKYTSLEKSCTLILLVYIDRVCQRNAGFTICSLTVHRFVCAAVVCASKALCDAFSTNGHYARVGGISLVELNMLEKEFLNIIDWKLSCSGALLQHYYTSLVRSHGAYRLDKSSSVSDAEGAS